MIAANSKLCASAKTSAASADSRALGSISMFIFRISRPPTDNQILHRESPAHTSHDSILLSQLSTFQYCYLKTTVQKTDQEFKPCGLLSSF